MRDGSTAHFIVASTRAERRSGIRYRRNRLADHLLSLPSTHSVTWISPRSVDLVSSPWLLLDAARIGTSAIPPGGPHETRLFQTRRTFRGLSTVIRRHLRYRAGERHGEEFTRVLWFTHPTLPELADACRWDAIVYDCSDYWSQLIPGAYGPREEARRNRLAEAEIRIVRAADLLFASSEFLADHLRSLGREAILVENGVDFDAFSAASPIDSGPLPTIGGPRIVFSGSMKSKIDFSLLREVSIRRRDWNLILIGPDSDRDTGFQRLVQEPNVYWLGQVEGNEISSYLKRCDLGLLPYLDAEYNRGVFPLKLFEYLGAGLPVVGCSLPSTARYVEAGVYRLTDSDVESFSEACAEALRESTAHERSRRLEIAKAASWASRFEEITRRLNSIDRQNSRSRSFSETV